ncbi:MAG: BrnT family toxin [Treponema sp.]|nr:BrnT family toxin [Treponema sp.]MCI6892022.1 BrnT family toxin [Treponema sp.]
MPKGELVVCGKFEWWSEKDEINIDTHKDANNIGISFRDILPVFDDPYFYEIYDIHHSEKNQDRYNGLGYVEKTGLSVVQVVYTETGRTHIISARPATSRERKMYYERLRKIYSEM